MHHLQIVLIKVLMKVFNYYAKMKNLLAYTYSKGKKRTEQLIKIEHNKEKN